MEEEDAARIVSEILYIFEINKVHLSEASGILGGIFAYIAIRTEENFPFISFLNSFTRSYSINYSGEEIHEVAGPVVIKKGEKKDSYKYTGPLANE